MSGSPAEAAVFGAFDGIASAVGVVGAAVVVGARPQTIVATAAGLAVAATASMAGGEWLSEESTDRATVAAMGGATLLGSFLPAAPLVAFGRSAGVAVCVAVCVAAAFGIGEARHRLARVGRWRSQAETWAVLAAAAGLAVLAGALLGAVG